MSLEKKLTQFEVKTYGPDGEKSYRNLALLDVAIQATFKGSKMSTKDIGDGICISSEDGETNMNVKPVYPTLKKVELIQNHIKRLVP